VQERHASRTRGDLGEANRDLGGLADRASGVKGEAKAPGRISLGEGAPEGFLALLAKLQETAADPAF
jgi:hypothetical protein